MRKYRANRTAEMTQSELEHLEQVRKLAGECMVILENDGILPLKQVGKVALYGNGARHTIKGGTGSGDVNARQIVSIEQGLKDAGFEIMTERWLNTYDEQITEAKEVYQKKIKKLAADLHKPEINVAFDYPYEDPDAPEISEKEEADLAVYVLSRNSGEGKDRDCRKGDYLLTDREEANIRYITEHYEKSIVLLNTGGIIDTSFLRSLENLNALVIIGQTGSEGGHIVADVLTGKTIPSGKLTDTWAKDYYDYPSSADYSHNNGDVNDEYYKEDIFVGYRYFDTFDVEPAYCFGYGKTYTEFTIRPDQVELYNGYLVFWVEVTNSGKEYAGKEVIQVYASAPEGQLEKPYQELVAFKKTEELQPGDSELMMMRVPLAALASYSSAEAAWKLEAGDYLIRMGNSSRSTQPLAVVRIEQMKKTEQLKNLFDVDAKMETIIDTEHGKTALKKKNDRVRKETEKALEFVPVVVADLSQICCEEIVYSAGVREEMKDHFPEKMLTMEQVKNGDVRLEDLVAQLTVEELANLCVGTERLEDDANQIGCASDRVIGAAGETWSGLEENRKIPVLILADGPAGLRLQPHFKTTSDGEKIPGGEVFGMAYRPFPADLPADTADYYQYCTAIPIASTLAQSWDMSLIRQMGEIVGEEMQQFGVHLWLAPGMNIHRNPLCGRNFEYYSEDPYLTGRCAAADTLGVQSVEGQGTTIKHFAANNQEDNRNYTNAHISERALREIYLRGFEIAVKEAHPYAIMTSYNLINGIHSANRYDLLQTAAREEWGFDGFVMTDWYATQDTSIMGQAPDKYTWASAKQAIHAGNDMLMPGCALNVEDLINGAEEGTEMTLADLQHCVRNILAVGLRTMR